MGRKPKLQTVAKAAGVSTATASQVLRGAGRISDATRKGMPRMKFEELCLYQVKDGKITKEQFFYSMPAA